MFIYSKRKGTPAAQMDNQVSKEDKRARFERLMDLQSKASESFHKKYVGQTLRVLADNIPEGNKEVISGRASNNIIVQANQTENIIKPGEFFTVEITDSVNWVLIGKIIN